MACGHGPGTLFNSLTKPRIYCCPSQPIQALEHPKFKDMIDFASRATNGVKIPGQKATQGGIKNLFKSHVVQLKAQLNIRSHFGPLALVLCSSCFRVRLSKAKLA
jgi:hypothetical protein